METNNNTPAEQLLQLIDAAEFTFPSLASVRPVKLWELESNYNESTEKGVWFGSVSMLVDLLRGSMDACHCSLADDARRLISLSSVYGALKEIEAMHPGRFQRRDGPGAKNLQIRAPQPRSPRCVLQGWVLGLPMMQQTVLLTAVRGPDGHPKYSDVKLLLRWYRRCLLLSALDGAVLDTPYQDGGGSFTGPSCKLADCQGEVKGGGQWESWMPAMHLLVDAYLRSVDSLPHHFQMHFMHAVEIMGYKHPAADIASFWASTYIRLVNDMHLHPESEAELDARLGDDRDGWLARADPATAA